MSGPAGRQQLADGDPGAARPGEVRRRRPRHPRAPARRRRAEVDRCFREFEFSAAAQALYGFFWNDFCDWYVEVSKSKLQDAGHEGQLPRDPGLGAAPDAAPPPSVHPVHHRGALAAAGLRRPEGRLHRGRPHRVDASQSAAALADARRAPGPGPGRVRRADEGVRVPGARAQGRARRRQPARRPVSRQGGRRGLGDDRRRTSPKLLRMAGAAEIIRRRATSRACPPP